jgi:hypothetical protein
MVTDGFAARRRSRFRSWCDGEAVERRRVSFAPGETKAVRHTPFS